MWHGANALRRCLNGARVVGKNRTGSGAGWTCESPHQTGRPPTLTPAPCPHDE